MINVVNEVLTTKTVDQYKIIEDRYLTLKRYLKLQIQKNSYISAEDLEMVMKSLDNEPIKEIKEENNEQDNSNRQTD